MDNTREKPIDVHSKLMGLLQRTPYIKCEDVYRQYAVNWLMNNGVTVQKWIPVTERLPDTGKVLCITTKGHYKVMEWLETFNCWTDPGGIDFTNFKRGYVTHWMPLPEPPKGE